MQEPKSVAGAPFRNIRPKVDEDRRNDEAVEKTQGDIGGAVTKTISRPR